MDRKPASTPRFMIIIITEKERYIYVAGEEDENKNI